jgi:SHS family lactate transporter-like MFS transporter
MNDDRMKPAEAAPSHLRSALSLRCGPLPGKPVTKTMTEDGGWQIMSGNNQAAKLMPWWKEPTKDQWYAYTAAWLGWTLDAFDFTVFLVLIVPIAKEFDAPLTAVALVGTLTLWMRLIGAVSAGWMADRMGRRAPLMISILWYSICNFIAGFSPTFIFLLFFRTLLGIGMGAEWPAGAALAMETWPTRSRGLMSAVLQNSWAIGYLISALLYATIFDVIGWRGMLWLGVLPALAVVWIRFYVKEPEIWVENQRLQKASAVAVKTPLFEIFKRKMIWNTLTACLWMASGFVTYYSTAGLFATWLTKDLHMSPAAVGWPLVFFNIATFVSAFAWGAVADRYGRRIAMIIPAVIGLFVTPLYLMSTSYTMIAIGFAVQGAFAGSMYTQIPAYMNERFPTEVRATAAAFCYHQGAIFGGLMPLVLTWFAIDWGFGFAMPMMIASAAAICIYCVALLAYPDTHGQEMTAELQLAPSGDD